MEPTSRLEGGSEVNAWDTPCTSVSGIACHRFMIAISSYTLLRDHHPSGALHRGEIEQFVDFEGVTMGLMPERFGELAHQLDY